MRSNFWKKTSIDFENEKMFRWGEAEWDRQGKGELRTGEDFRKILGDFLYLIRFPLMELQDFEDVVLPTGILSKKQSKMLYAYLSLPHEDR